MKAITFMALTLGIGSIANAQLYEGINRQAGIAFRANDDSSRNNEYFRFFTGSPSGTNYIAELNHNSLILNGRSSSQGANVLSPVGKHFSIKSIRGIDIRSDIDGSSSSENIRFQSGISSGGFITIAEIDENGVSMTRLKARNNTLPIRVGSTDIMDLSDNRVAFRRNIVLNTNGNDRIGIGTANPSEKLHVNNGDVRIDNGRLISNGNLVFRPGLVNNGSDAIEFRNSSNIEMARIKDGDITLIKRDGQGGKIRSTEAIEFRPEADRNGNLDKVSFFDSTGKEKTRIQDGIIITDEVRLNVTTFPDYVFAKDYNLMSLKEVAAYIKENKHLPNMPTEAEVVANGMNVSQINTVLVEKVEELTLHTINQEEQLQSQEQKIALLLKKIATLEAAINK